MYEGLGRAIRQEKEIKGIQIVREEAVIADDLMLYVENSIKIPEKHS